MFPDGRLSGRPIAALLEASGLKEAAESYEQEEASPVSIREHIQKNIIVNALESAKGMLHRPPKWPESRGARFTNASKIQTHRRTIVRNKHTSLGCRTRYV